jgi:hypothetical protein
MKQNIILLLMMATFNVKAQIKIFDDNCYQKFEASLLEFQTISQTEDIYGKGAHFYPSIPCYPENRSTNPGLWEKQMKELVILNLKVINHIMNMSHYNIDTLDFAQGRVKIPSCYERTRVRKKVSLYGERQDTINRQSINLSRYPLADLSDFGDETCKQEYLKNMAIHKEAVRKRNYELMVDRYIFNVTSSFISIFYHTEDTNLTEFHQFADPLIPQYIDAKYLSKFKALIDALYTEKIKWNKK